jgi:hypothetical protein
VILYSFYALMWLAGASVNYEGTVPLCKKRNCVDWFKLGALIIYRLQGMR